MPEYSRQDSRKVLIIGSTCCDVRIEVDHLPNSEEDLSSQSQAFSLGGCAFNVANMQRLFHQPYTLFSPVGTGIYGDFVRKSLRDYGMEPEISVPEENGSCYCLIEPNGNRSFIAVHGAEYRFRKTWFDTLDQQAYSAIYFCGLEMEEESGENILAFLETLDLTGRRLYYAPGPRGDYVLPERRKRIHALHPILHLNLREAQAQIGQNLPLRRAAESLSYITDNDVILTDGARGAGYFEKKTGRFCFQASEAVKQIDGTGAGDSHIGSFIAMREKGFSIEACLKKAGEVAAKVIQVKGTTIDSGAIEI